MRADHVNDTVHIASPQVKRMIESRAKDNLRYRLLHLPATLSSHARQRTLKIPETWPWTDAFILCWQRLTALPAPT